MVHTSTTTHIDIGSLRTQGISSTLRRIRNIRNVPANNFIFSIFHFSVRDLEPFPFFTFPSFHFSVHNLSLFILRFFIF